MWYVYIRGLAKTGNQGGFTLFLKLPPPPCFFIKSFLGIDLSILIAWIVLKKHLLFWVVSCGRMTLALCLILLRITSLTFGSYGRLDYNGENLSVPQSQCQNSSGELGDVGDGGRLRCLHGKVDTTISCMCT